MVRPLKAVNAVHAAMGAMLGNAQAGTINLAWKGQIGRAHV